MALQIKVLVPESPGAAELFTGHCFHDGDVGFLNIAGFRRL